MQDFDRDYKDHIAGNYPDPDNEDLKKNFKVKLIAGIAIAIILTAIVLDTLEFIDKWG